jgi:DNA end-binding protein Ku
MSRSTWSGSLALGLLSVPIELHTSVREQDVRFRQLCGEHNVPIKLPKICTEGGEELEAADVVKGFEVEKGRYVVLTDQDFERAAVPLLKELEIRVFVLESELDLRYLDKPYIALPRKKAPGAGRTYALLREAIRRTGTVGVGTITMRQKQHLAAVRVQGPAMVIQLMRWPDELVDTAPLACPAEEVGAAELELAEQLIGSRAGTVEAAGFRDEYRAYLQRIIEAREAGVDLSFEAPAPRPDAGVDLMAVLQASLAAAPARRAA